MKETTDEEIQVCQTRACLCISFVSLIDEKSEISFARISRLLVLLAPARIIWPPDATRTPSACSPRLVAPPGRTCARRSSPRRTTLPRSHRTARTARTAWPSAAPTRPGTHHACARAVRHTASATHVRACQRLFAPHDASTFVRPGCAPPLAHPAWPRPRCHAPRHSLRLLAPAARLAAAPSVRRAPPTSRHRPRAPAAATRLPLTVPACSQRLAPLPCPPRATPGRRPPALIAFRHARAAATSALSRPMRAAPCCAHASLHLICMLCFFCEF